PMIEKLQQESLLGEMLANRALATPGHTAIVFGQERISYAELDRRVDALACALLRRGITRTDRVAVLLPVRPEFLYVWLAAARIGCAVLGLNYRYQAKEITHMVNDTQASVLVCINAFADVDYAEFITSLRPALPSLKTFIFVGPIVFPGALDFDTLLAEEPEPKFLEKAGRTVRSEDDNFIIYTSGTTGRPKGAVLTQKSILAMMRPWARNTGLRQDDYLFCILPLNHVGGGTILALTTLGAGATLVLHDRFHPDDVLKIFRENQITVFGGVPTVYAILCSLPDATPELFASVRICGFGGAAASPVLIRQMRRCFSQAAIMACYGATEVSGFCTYTSPDDPFDKSLSTVGRTPAGIEVKIVDHASRVALSQGEIGEIAVRGDLIFDRYLNMPEETAQVIDGQGWYYTGDMGSFDGEGYLTIRGRYKEMYISGGYNVYPLEVEDVLSAHPAVAMTAVIGVPHPVKGEVGLAFVMPQFGAQPTPEELVEHCKTLLADYKVPYRIVIEPLLPMTGLGKLDKLKLREQYGHVVVAISEGKKEA
ncbi:MAG TPA: class I adenylate-forming enzyme family protein, partial [Deltaproteobacteria bacterium]|nr:class I adenylate-forming enzyme family protein [Deltaproteobacteria bacterium]